MKIQDLDFLRLLPRFMQKDEAVQGLSKGVEEFLQEAAKEVSTLSTWSQIENLSDDDLTELAWEFDVDWYDAAAPLEQKRQAIKDAQNIQAHRGTKWAIERLMKIYFGSGYIKEWFEVDGEPFTFTPYTPCVGVSADTLERFKHALESTKNARSRMLPVNYLWAEVMKLLIQFESRVVVYGIPECGTVECGYVYYPYPESGTKVCGPYECGEI